LKKQPKKKPTRRALDWDSLREKGIHYHTNHLRRMWQDGRFPQPFKLSPRKLAWWEHEVDAWLASKSKEAAA
jgi:predicted DNA-binding transcriptional regulator AlpA